MANKEFYSIRELLNEVSNAKQEFKAKVGNGVENSNKREQEKSVKEITKDAEKLDNPRRNQNDRRPEPINQEDYNKTTLDVNFEYDAPESYKKRVEVQALGYPSVYNKENNDYDPSLDFEGNKRFFDARKNMSKARNERDTDERESGLKAREKKTDYSNKTMFESKRPTKRLVFRNTQFLSEAQVLQRVPEDYRVDENKFYMQDKTGTDYLVECKADPFGFIHMEVTNRINKNEINEQLEKMRRLADYKYGDDNVRVDRRNLENMSESINEFRNLIKNN